MKTLLVIAKQSGLAAAVRSVLDPEVYRVIALEEVWQAEALLMHDGIDACLLDADLTDVQPVRILKQVRRWRDSCPILIFAGAKQWEWEEEAYLLGVAHILSKPVRGRLLNLLLDRITCERREERPAAGLPGRVIEVEPRPMRREPLWTLEVLRDFSSILTHSLDSEALLRQFVLLLREIIGVNRAALFLRANPYRRVDSKSAQSARRLQAVCVLGIQAGVAENFELTLSGGIGRYLYRSGRILRSGSDEARGDLEIQKEFELLGGQVAIPMLDRESLVGVAVFDGRLTGEFFSNEELSLIFHLLEGVSLAIKNSWLHDQLSVSHDMMFDVLNQLSGSCVVVGKNLQVLHWNESAVRVFGKEGKEQLDFEDLPQAVGSRVFEALRSGQEPDPFFHCPEGRAGAVFRVTITPFRRRDSREADAILLAADDCTQQEQAQQLAIEASNLRLVRSMADHLAHEIGNCLVPITTFKQLCDQAEQQSSEAQAVGVAADEALQRISRLTSQMFHLAQDGLPRTERVPMVKCIEESFRMARMNWVRAEGALDWKTQDKNLIVPGNFNSLRHAIAEVLLNAMQAAPGQPIEIGMDRARRAEGGEWLLLTVGDSGAGFSEESARHAVEPFYSTRVVGLGLGLTVAARIIGWHQGAVEVASPSSTKKTAIRIWLPLEQSGS